MSIGNTPLDPYRKKAQDAKAPNVGLRNPQDMMNRTGDALGVSAKAPAKKQSYAAYNESGGTFGKQYDVARKLDPIDQLGNLFGFKDPIHQQAEWGWNALTGSNLSNVNRVKFDNAGELSEQDREQLYNSMSPEELDQVGKMTDKDQGDWLKSRWSDVQSGAAKAWEDPSAPKRPGPAPDLADALLAQGRSAQLSGRGRRSTFLTQRTPTVLGG